MKTLRLAALLACIAAPATAQTCGTVTTCPNISTPLSGTELFYAVQAGVSKKITFNQFIASIPSFGGGAPGGSNTQLQYNKNGSFGGITGATTDGTTVTLTAPKLGTPSTLVLTNATGLTPSSGLSASGTPSSSTYLRGDNSWSSVAASGILTTQPGTGGLTITQQALNNARVSLTQFCASGSSDCTAGLQAAINYVQGLGSGEVWIPPGTWNFLGTVQVTNNGVTLRCPSRQTKLYFNNGASDDFQIGFQGSQIQEFNMIGCLVDHGTKTGGFAFNFDLVAYMTLDNVYINAPWNGVRGTTVNTPVFRDVQVNAPHGSDVFYFYDNPAGVTRSDAVTFDNVTVQCSTYTAIGLHVDGSVFDVRSNTLILLGCSYGQFWDNSAHNTTGNWPQFSMQHDTEVDGAKNVAIVINAGNNFYFVNSDISNTSGRSGQGSADTQSVYCAQDAGYSNTHGVTIVGGRINGARQQSALFSCDEVTLNGVIFDDSAKQGTGLFPMLEFDGNSQHIAVAGNSFNGRSRATSSVVIDAGSDYYAVTGNTGYGNTSTPFNCTGAGAASRICTNNAQ